MEFYYTFSFTYEFQAGVNDEVYFAHGIPYTYTDLQKKLLKIRQN